AKAALYKLNVDEVPTTLSPDLRSRPPHLRTWRDGWRTLRFFLLYSPKWLFFYPGVFLMAIGLVLSIAVIPRAIDVFGARLGVQVVLSSFFLSVLGIKHFPADDE